LGLPRAEICEVKAAARELSNASFTGHEAQPVRGAARQSPDHKNSPSR
jgi:hypothetical protein